MRVSEGVAYGRFTELYNPEMFQEHEEVIIFSRDEFNHVYSSMCEQIDHINKIDLHLDRSEEWKLMGYWPKIMAKVHILNVNMDSILKKEPLQCYLDAYLYNVIGSSKKNVAVAEKTAHVSYSP